MQVLCLALVLDLGGFFSIGLQSAQDYWNVSGELVSQRFDIQRIRAGIWGYGIDEGYVDWGLYLQGKCFASGDYRRCAGEWAALQYSRALPMSDQMVLVRFLVGWDLNQRPYAERAQMSFPRPESLWLARFESYRVGAAFVGLSSRWLFPSGGLSRFVAGLDALFNFPEAEFGRESRFDLLVDFSFGEEVGVGVEASYNLRFAEDLGNWIFPDTTGGYDTLSVTLPSTRVMYLTPYFFVHQGQAEFRLWMGLPGRIPFSMEGFGIGGMGGVIRQMWGVAIEGRWSPLNRFQKQRQQRL